MRLRIVLQTIRPSFLILTPICVFLSLSTAFATSSQINYLVFLLVLIGALSAHVSVNTLNEYYDFKSGLDLQTKKTPFSGGSGALPSQPEMANVILVIGIITLILTAGIGIYLIMTTSIKLLFIGLIGIGLIITYTQWLNRYPLLCLVAPGLGFGILMVIGSHLVLTGGYTQLVLLVSLIPFFLINNLLLLNQYPDITADASVGRNTFPIAFGIKKSNIVYTIFMGFAYIEILLLIAKGHLPQISIIALIPLMFSLYALIGAIKHTSKIGDYPIYLAANVAATLLVPLLLAGTIIYSKH